MCMIILVILFWWQRIGPPRPIQRFEYSASKKSLPTKKPDLNPLDFFLWGYVKNVVYGEAPTTRENMIQRIRRAYLEITRGMLQEAVHNFRRRIILCLENAGGHFEHLMD